MSTDPFDAIVAGLELEEIPQRIKDLDSLELVQTREKVRQELLQSGEMVVTTTARGRQLQQELVTLQAEMTERGLF